MFKLNIENLLRCTNRNISFNEEKNRVEGNLSELLKKSKDEEFYYIGISDFVKNYFIENDSSDWSLRAVFNLGYPFVYIYGPIWKSNWNNIPKDPNEYPNCRIYENLAYKTWFLFVFTRKKIESVFVGFVIGLLERN